MGTGTLAHRGLGQSGITVSALGLGCMGMSEFYGPADESQSLAVLERALELGVSHFDTADMYGHGHNESLLGRFLKGRRERVVLATKFALVREQNQAGQYERRVDSSPAYLARAVEASLKRLGIETIDLYYAHRLDGVTPVEETVGAMAELVTAGKVRALGLSEVSGPTLRRAQAVHPIAAVQTEYSLWTRDPEADVLPVCRELGVSLVAYSPLGRGFLTGTIETTENLAADDYRRHAPRLQDENLAANLKLVAAVKALAAEKGASAGQIALAWLLAQGPEILPIPGTKRLKYLEENVGSAALSLSAADLARLDAALPPGAAAGHRYPSFARQGLNA